MEIYIKFKIITWSEEAAKKASSRKKGGDLNCPDKKNILGEDQRKDS